MRRTRDEAGGGDVLNNLPQSTRIVETERRTTVSRESVSPGAEEAALQI